MLGLLLLELCLVTGSGGEITDIDKTNVSIIEWDIIETYHDHDKSDMMMITDADR